VQLNRAKAAASARAGRGVGTGAIRNVPGTSLLLVITREPTEVG
jgi:hypothetical protein